MKQTLNELDKTSVLLQKHIDTYSNKISLSHFDFFCCVSSYKHLQLVKGFSLLIRQNNYPSAVPVFLEHVNLCLQIYASTLIKYHPNLFAKKMINNNKLNYMKDGYGRYMKKKYLLNRLSLDSGLSWLNDLFDNQFNFICCPTFKDNDSLNINYYNLIENPSSNELVFIELSIKFKQISNLIIDIIKPTNKKKLTNLTLQKS